MPELPTTSSIETAAPQSYEQFLEDIKGRIRSAQARAARAINAELIEVYWQIGREILQRQAEEGDRRGRGGPKIVERLSADLRAAFPGARGFSVSSLRYMRAFAAAWPEREMLQSGTGALPWAHIMLLLDKLSDRTTRDWYASRATSWSKAELAHHIANRLPRSRRSRARAGRTAYYDEPTNTLEDPVAALRELYAAGRGFPRSPSRV
jgi:predicted nuclease of restriction endonuclease-like (RecB) superfamily